MSPFSSRCPGPTRRSFLELGAYSLCGLGLGDLAKAAKSTEKEGKVLNSFMLLEYDDKGAFNGRIDGKKAELQEGYWKMFEIQITPRYGETTYQNNLSYKTNIKPEDISDSLSSPSSISIWRLLTFISFLEELGYSAIDFKMHLYSLISLPFFISALVLLAFCIVQGIKQNDKFSKIIFSPFNLL